LKLILYGPTDILLVFAEAAEMRASRIKQAINLVINPP